MFTGCQLVFVFFLSEQYEQVKRHENHSCTLARLSSFVETFVVSIVGGHIVGKSQQSWTDNLKYSGAAMQFKCMFASLQFFLFSAFMGALLL